MPFMGGCLFLLRGAHHHQSSQHGLPACLAICSEHPGQWEVVLGSLLLGCSDVAARMLCRCCASPADPAVALHVHHVCCAGTDRKISYWDAYNGTAIRILEPNTSNILGWVAISSSGNWLVTGMPQLREATAMSYMS